MEQLKKVQDVQTYRPSDLQTSRSSRPLYLQTLQSNKPSTSRPPDPQMSPSDMMFFTKNHIKSHNSNLT